jgi:hypothetical protein
VGISTSWVAAGKARVLEMLPEGNEDSSDSSSSVGFGAQAPVLNSLHALQQLTGVPDNSATSASKAGLDRVSPRQCLHAIRHQVETCHGPPALLVKQLISDAPLTVSAETSEVVEWQLQAAGCQDDMALSALTTDLERQLSSILYHIGWAISLQERMPQPPAPLDSFQYVTIQPSTHGLPGQTPSQTTMHTYGHVEPLNHDCEGSSGTGVGSIGRPLAQVLSIWLRVIQLELAVENGTATSEYCPQLLTIKCLTRVGHLLHAAVGATRPAIAVLSFGAGLLLKYPRLAAAAARDVAPVLWICLSTCKASLGDFVGSTAAGKLCIDGLRTAKDVIDARDGVDLMAAMQYVSLLA